MKKTAKFGIVALLLLGLVASAFAFSGRGFGNQAAKEALEAGDYGAWKGAMTEGLTEERFNHMREREQEMEGKRAEMQENRAEVEAAIDAGDYEAWLSAIEGKSMGKKHSEVITKDNFDTFVEMHNARKSEDFETAKALAEKLGFEGLGRGHGGKAGSRGRLNQAGSFE